MSSIDLRENLTPKGTLNVIRLFFENPFFNGDFIAQCITEAEALSATGSKPSPLQKLALYALLDSAYIFNPRDVREAERRQNESR
jgi:hypothetical protein